MGWPGNELFLPLPGLFWPATGRTHHSILKRMDLKDIKFSASGTAVSIKGVPGNSSRI
jgi:hypothetical protein